MKHFLKIAANVDVMPLLVAVQAHPELWDQNTLRTTHEHSPHKAVSDIWLRFNELKENPAEAIDDIHAVPYPAWDALPQVRPIIFDLMRRVEGTQLGRCLITKLPPGTEITPHIDQGTPATYYTRFQVAIQSLPGCNFHIEDESVQFQAGDVWLINNKKTHSVVNNSADDRIVMIVDIRTK